MINLNLNPYSFDKKTKEEYFSSEVNKLTRYHYNKSKVYKKIIDSFGYNKKKDYELNDLPFVSTRIFKEVDLLSIKKSEIFKILRSSGTSGSVPSKIFLDKKNANEQRKILNKIFSYSVCEKRLPILIIGKKPNFDKLSFDAKAAAILGFLIFGFDHHYFLDQKDRIDKTEFNNFFEKYQNKKFLIFGFTSDVYLKFLNNKQFNNKIDLSNGILLHGGGWKKLASLNISNNNFKKKILDKFNLKKVINYYGLIEQVGSIFFECSKCNVFICSDYSDLIIRDRDLNPIEKGIGFVQLMSLIPTSYPGHNILTEDLGEIVSLNGCDCGKKGKTFRIHGRILNSEIRGCSNV